jgi:3',5'-cyclic AMP phosphodiesterase CpdA
MLIAQISDCHIVDPGSMFADRTDSAEGLRRAVDTIVDLPIAPDLVLLTGDLVNDGTPSQYDHLLELLGGLQIPMLPIPGNHDDRRQLRSRFPTMLPSGSDDEPIDVVHDVGPVRVVALDTTIPGRHDGDLTDRQLAWLDEQLGRAPDRPTIVAQHHPPISSGMVWMDAMCGFAAADREAVVIGRHRQVEAVVSGHLHRSLQRRYAGTVSITCPSTAGALALGLRGGLVEYTTEPTAFLLHHWRENAGLVSHLVPVGDFESWSPAWVTTSAQEIVSDS